jgi:hypothetical protein
VYDLGVWARMTGSSKAQGQGDTYHSSWIILFLGQIYGRLFDIIGRYSVLLQTE